MKIRKTLLASVLSTLVLMSSNAYSEDQSVNSDQSKDLQNNTQEIEKTALKPLSVAEKGVFRPKDEAIFSKKSKYDDLIEQAKNNKNLSNKDRKMIIEHYTNLKLAESEEKAANAKFDAVVQDVKDTQASIASLLGVKLEGFEGKKEFTKKDHEELMKKLSGMFQVTAPLDVKYLIAIETDSKHMILMNETGRFVFKGDLYDTYNGMKKLNNVDDIRNYALKTNYKALKLDPETLSSARIGNGEKEVVIYVDAESSITTSIIDQVNDYPDRDSYTFYFVPIPADSAKSKDLAMKFYCAREAGNSEIGNLLYSGGLDKLSTDKCNFDNFQKTIAAAYYTNVDGLPFFVDYDGSISRGVPAQGLYQWLASHRSTNLDGRFVPKEIKEDLQKKLVKRGSYQLVTKEEQAQAVQNYKTPVSEEEEEENSDFDALSVVTEEEMNEAEEKIQEMELSQQEKKEYSSEQIAHEPFNFKSESADLNGFDMKDEIDRYKREAQVTDEDPLVVDNVDQNTAYDVNGDTEGQEESLKKYEELDESRLIQERKGKNRHLATEIEQMQMQIVKVRNEYNQRRLDLKNKYDEEYQDYEDSFDFAERHFGEKKKIRRQREVRKYQQMLYKKYKDKIESLNREENESIKNLVHDINYLKGAMQ